MSEYKVPLKEIEAFLHGFDDESHIVNIEFDYDNGKIYKLIDHPEKGKIIVEDTFTPFVWIKNPDRHEFGKDFYGGQSNRILQAKKDCSLTLNKLRTDNHLRLEDGYSFILEATNPEDGFKNIRQFFSKGGIKVTRDTTFVMSLSPIEQFLIQKGKRLFKGIDEADGIHKMVFDLETTGLDPNTCSIFAIGIKDNRGFEKVLWCWDEESERRAIIEFFEIIAEIKPSVLMGYNSENFDWPFIEVRCKMLGLEIEKIAKTRHPARNFKRVPKVLKLGNEVEDYMQTVMWGMSIVDIYHAVRRAQAIDSDMKRASLKYVCQYNGVAKANRVYVDGGKIFKIANENKEYLFNKQNGKYVLFDDPKCNGWLEKRPDVYEKITGVQIIERYLLDDLWETMMVDSIYNQTAFLLAKVVPTGYERVATMGTAGYWKLLMSGWSYLNHLAIPNPEPKRDFVGGLSRLLLVGFSKLLSKADFSSLYPAIQLAHDIFPSVDITGALKSLLKYFHSERFKAKGLQEKFAAEGNKQMASYYKRKQLPLKIFINSMYGALTAPHAFPWGEFDKGEQVTCSGRQYLRIMVKFFMDRGFKPCVLDTDGVNFVTPDLTNYKYIGRGLHERTEIGVEYTGIDGVIAEFNDTYMQGEMGLDIDGQWPATINISRKNYALLEYNGKVKLTGNTIKSKSIPEFVEDFLNVAFPLLLEDKGYEFVEYYNEYIEKIFNQQIPLRKIANKSRVKQSIESYLKRGTNVNGNLLPKQAHMELAILNKLKPSLGDTIYYVNNGTIASHGDVTPIYEKNEMGKTIKYLIDDNEEFIKDQNGNLILAQKGEPGKGKEIGIYAYMIDYEELEKDPDKIGPYNIPKMVETFNKRVEPLLIAFDSSVRNLIIRNVSTNIEVVERQKDLIKYEKLKEKSNIKIVKDLEKLQNKFLTQTDKLRESHSKKVGKVIDKNLQPYELGQAFSKDLANLTREYEETKVTIENEHKMAQLSIETMIGQIKRLDPYPYTLAPKQWFMVEELGLVSGQPIEESDQDSLEELFTPDEREVAFWKRTHNYDPRIWENFTKFDLPGFKKGDI